MKKSSLMKLGVLAMIGLTWSGCDSLPKQVDLKSKEAWDVIAPIGYGSFGIKELADKNTTDKDIRLEIDKDAMYLKYSKGDLLTFTMSDFVKGSMINCQTTIDYPANGFDQDIMIKLSQPINGLISMYSRTGKFEIKVPKKIKSVKRLLLDATLTIKVNGLSSALGCKLTLTNVRDHNGNPVTLMIDENKTYKWNLNHVVLSFSSEEQPEVGYKIEPKIKSNISSDIVIRKGDRASFGIEMTNVVVDAFEGKVEPIIFDLDQQMNQLDTPISLKEAKDLKFAGSRIDLNIEASGVDAKAGLDLKCTPKDQKPYSLHKDLTINTYDTQTPQSLQVRYDGEEVSTLLQDLLSHSATMSGELKTPASDDAEVRLTKDSKVKVSMEMAQPLKIGIGALYVTEKIENTDLSSIKNYKDRVNSSIGLRIIGRSSIPLTLEDLSLTLLDEQQKMLPNGKIGTKGSIQAGSEDKPMASEVNITLTKQQIEALANSASIELKFKIHTENGTIISLKPSQSIEFSVIAMTNPESK